MRINNMITINEERLTKDEYIDFLKRTDLGSQYPKERFEELKLAAIEELGGVVDSGQTPAEETVLGEDTLIEDDAERGQTPEADATQDQPAAEPGASGSEIRDEVIVFPDNDDVIVELDSEELTEP